MRRSLNRAIALGLCLIVLLTAVVWRFRNRITRDLESSGLEALRESALQSIDTFRARLDGQYYVLDALSSHLGSDFLDLEGNRKAVRDSLRDVAVAGEFFRLSAVDKSGAGYTSDGVAIDLSAKNFFQSNLRGERALELINATDGSGVADGDGTAVRIAVPARLNGEIVGALTGSCRSRVFRELLKTEAFGGEAEVLIVGADGEVKLAGGSRGTALDLSAIRYDEGRNAAGIRAELLAHEDSFFSFHYEGEKRYAACAPLGMNDWYIFCVVPARAVMRQSESITRNALFMSGELALLACLAVYLLLRSERRREKQIAQERDFFRVSEERYRLMEDMVDSVLFEIDLAEDTLTFNHNFEKLFGRKSYAERAVELLQKNPNLHPDDEATYHALAVKLNEGDQSGRAELRLKTSGGNYLWVRIEFLTVSDVYGTPRRVIGKITNIDESRRSMETLREKAETDGMTGLYNHAALRERIGEILRIGGGEKHALIVLDVDNFKRLNDRGGHQMGDSVLKSLAEGMKSLSRRSDLAGRLGGDEFCLFLLNMSDESIARDKIKALGVFLRNRSRENGWPDEVTVSAGLSVYPGDGDSFEALYDAADQALYEAKAQGKDRMVIHGKG